MMLISVSSGLKLLPPVGGVALCPELLEMYRAPVELMAALGRDAQRGPHDEAQHRTP